MPSTLARARRASNGNTINDSKTTTNRSKNVISKLNVEFGAGGFILGSMRFPVLAAIVLAAGISAEPVEIPALYMSGRLPVVPVNSVEVGGGEVLLEVTVDRTGAVSVITPLRETPAFMARMIAAVKTWRFSPAEAPIEMARRKPGGPTTEAVESKVLVAAVFRRPSINAPTLGEPIKDVAPASSDIPYPTSLVTPPFPITALNPGIVLVEVKVDAKGAVSGASVRVAAAGFDSAALTAANGWRFRAAKPGGAAGPSVAYIVFGFPVPRG